MNNIKKKEFSVLGKNDLEIYENLFKITYQKTLNFIKRINYIIDSSNEENNILSVVTINKMNIIDELVKKHVIKLDDAISRLDDITNNLSLLSSRMEQAYFVNGNLNKENIYCKENIKNYVDKMEEKYSEEEYVELIDLAFKKIDQVRILLYDNGNLSDVSESIMDIYKQLISVKNSFIRHEMELEEALRSVKICLENLENLEKFSNKKVGTRLVYYAKFA